MGSPSPSSLVETILPLSAQKHDPAWRHCLMVKRGEKTHLKCIYCLKIFSGGGIHRIKEHLACQKGNASRCDKVLPEVRDAMRDSLEGVMIKKQKKQRLSEEVKNLNPVTPSDELAAHMGLDGGSPLSSTFQISTIEQGSSNPGKSEDASPVKVSRKRSKRKATTISSIKRLDMTPIDGNSQIPDQAYMAIGRFLYEAGVPLHAVHSSYFRSMIDAVASAGPGLESPSYHDIRGWVLKRNLDEMRLKAQQLKNVWARNGCSILVDEWSTEMNRTLVNFLVYSSEGTLFLKSVDVSEIVTSADTLHGLLKNVVEEVGVKHVIQVITNNSNTHACAGKMLMETFPNVFWTPCSIQSVDSILMDFRELKKISLVLEQARTITSFIYSHAPILNMMRRYTGGKDLVQPSISSAATDFLTLNAMYSLKSNLHAMMTSKEWMDCPFSKVSRSFSVADLTRSPEFWSSCSTIVDLTEPFLQLLKIADSGTRPAMPYIYVGMHCARQRIRKELKRNKDYLPYWNIVASMEKELRHPLHLAGFFLNPQLFYKIEGEIPNEIMSGMLDCIERLVPDMKVQDKINKELSIYKNATGDFGRNMAIRARHTLLPAEWWSTYGGACPNLTRLAVRILSQTCNARRFDHQNIPFEQIHSQKKNSLEEQRFQDLIFVSYNLRIQQRPFLRNHLPDPIAVDNCTWHVQDWLVENTDSSSIGVSSSWMELAQLGNSSLFENAKAEDDNPLVNGFGEEIFGLFVEEEEGDEDGDDIIEADSPRVQD